MIENVKFGEDDIHEIVEIGDNKYRKKLIILDTKGMIYEDKKKIIVKELKKVYGEIPKGITFEKIKTEKTKIIPDGFRILIKCDWIKRNRFYDYNNGLKFGRILKAINKHIKNGDVNEN